MTEMHQRRHGCADCRPKFTYDISSHIIEPVVPFAACNSKISNFLNARRTFLTLSGKHAQKQGLRNRDSRLRNNDWTALGNGYETATRGRK
jgi:hypothetical protein